MALQNPEWSLIALHKHLLSNQHNEPPNKRECPIKTSSLRFLETQLVSHIEFLTIEHINKKRQCSRVK